MPLQGKRVLAPGPPCGFGRRAIGAETVGEVTWRILGLGLESESLWDVMLNVLLRAIGVSAIAGVVRAPERLARTPRRARILEPYIAFPRGDWFPFTSTISYAFILIL